MSRGQNFVPATRFFMKIERSHDGICRGDKVAATCPCNMSPRVSRPLRAHAYFFEERPRTAKIGAPVASFPKAFSAQIVANWSSVRIALPPFIFSICGNILRGGDVRSALCNIVTATLQAVVIRANINGAHNDTTFLPEKLQGNLICRTFNDTSWTLELRRHFITNYFLCNLQLNILLPVSHFHRGNVTRAVISIVTSLRCKIAGNVALYEKMLFVFMRF